MNYKRFIYAFTVLLLLVSAIPATAQAFYKTPSGAKYHLASCRTVKNVSEQITIARAKELLLEPCKICNPANLYAKSSAVNKAKGQQKTTVQCKGLTKAGTRCKHNTSIAGGYCFQHTPDNKK